ncbi:MAG TPA: kelch repeat-containing protein [Chitinophagales bacterium]|nr:kelch repeat-containing protein [Chitinophagales bacterium]
MKNSLLLITLFCLQQSVYAQQGEWTWMKGSSGNAPNATYGTQGVPAASNTPEGLYEPCEWKDKSGNFWLYGGLNNAGDYASNLWKYDVATNEWTWVKGPGLSSGELPNYGTQGVAAPTNTPGSRGWGAASWVDTAGNFWLFGSRSLSNDGGYADLWKYDVSINEWTWMKGGTTPYNNDGIYGTQGVSDAANNPGGRSETNASWTDKDNNLWLFGGHGYDVYGDWDALNDFWKYSIAANEWTWMRGSKVALHPGYYGIKGVEDTLNNPPSRMVFAKFTDADGNFWFFGGGSWNSYDYYNDVWKYNPVANKWTWVSGSNVAGDPGTAGNLCDSSTGIVGPSRFENRFSWTDSCGTFWTFGGGTGGNVDIVYNDLWHFDPQNLEWTMTEGSVVANQTGSYGTQSVSSPTNQPPSRGGGVSWIDNEGNLWMWGGIYNFVTYFNDLWRYVVDPSCSFSPCTYTQPPSSQAHFAASDTLLCEKFCISYFDSSSNNPTSWQWIFPGGNPSSSTDQNPTNICYDVPGSYDVTLIATGANGNDTLTLTNYIVVYPTPPFPTITQAGYTLTSSPANSYQWQFNSGDIPGATNQSYTVLQTGYYTVVVGDSNGCKNSTTTYVLITGIDDGSGDGNISIYPNPTADGLMVEWLNGFAGDEISISIFNALGQEIFSSQESRSIGKKKEIDLHGIASGVYFIQIKSHNTFLKKKIIIAR